MSETRNLIYDFQREVELAQREHKMGGFAEVEINVFNGKTRFTCTIWKQDSANDLICMGAGKSIHEAVNCMIKQYNTPNSDD